VEGAVWYLIRGLLYGVRDGGSFFGGLLCTSIGLSGLLCMFVLLLEGLIRSDEEGAIDSIDNIPCMFVCDILFGAPFHVLVL
jgi:hypothetical protein